MVSHLKSVPSLCQMDDDVGKNRGYSSLSPLKRVGVLIRTGLSLQMRKYSSSFLFHSETMKVKERVREK